MPPHAPETCGLQIPLLPRMACQPPTGYIARLREERVPTRLSLGIIQHELNFLAFQPDGEQPLNLHNVERIAVPGHADAHREVIPGIDERGEEYEGQRNGQEYSHDVDLP